MRKLAKQHSEPTTDKHGAKVDELQLMRLKNLSVISSALGLPSSIKRQFSLRTESPT